jgi:hypothetical protein
LKTALLVHALNTSVNPKIPNQLMEIALKYNMDPELPLEWFRKVIVNSGKKKFFDFFCKTSFFPSILSKR